MIYYQVLSRWVFVVSRLALTSPDAGNHLAHCCCVPGQHCVPAELISGELNSGHMCPFTLPSTMWKEPLPTASPPPSSSLCQSDGEKMYLSVAVICSSLIMCEAFKNHSHFLFYDYLFLPFAQSYWLLDHSTVPLTTPHPQHPYLD